MSQIILRLLCFTATCENGHSVLFHAFPDMEYAQFLVRTRKMEYAVATVNDLLREASAIVKGLIDETGLQDKGNDCFQSVLGEVFDKSPTGLKYHFSEIFCPDCGSSKMVSREPVEPKQVEELVVQEVTYDGWQKLSKKEKSERLRNALREIGCY